MNDLIKVDDLPEIDISEYLDSPETIAAYFNEILVDGNSALLAAAMGDIARARSMTDVARKAGMTREALYKALRPDSSPRFETISKVCQAFGLRLTVVPIEVPDAAFLEHEEAIEGAARESDIDHGPAGAENILRPK